MHAATTCPSRLITTPAIFVPPTSRPMLKPVFRAPPCPSATPLTPPPCAFTTLLVFNSDRITTLHSMILNISFYGSFYGSHVQVCKNPKTRRPLRTPHLVKKTQENKNRSPQTSQALSPTASTPHSKAFKGGALSTFCSTMVRQQKSILHNRRAYLLLALLAMLILLTHTHPSLAACIQQDDCDGDGVSTAQDCNDNDPDVGWVNDEAAFEDYCDDGKDNDCDGIIDCTELNCRLSYGYPGGACEGCFDWDSDGAVTDQATSCPTGGVYDCYDPIMNPEDPSTLIFLAPRSLYPDIDPTCDCDLDNQPPLEYEICGNGIDDDCFRDDTLGKDPACTQPCSAVDQDGDQYGTPPQWNCENNKRYNIIIPDCDDTNPNIYPQNPNPYCDCDPSNGVKQEADICGNGIDEDCDGQDLSCSQSCTDNDNDGYGSQASSQCAQTGLDCNDADAAVNPGATELCTNGKDDDCDGSVDCDDADCFAACQTCTDTCTSLGKACGLWTICNELQNCGTCPQGQSCNANGECVNECVPTHAFEICGNSVDEDCDGTILETCSCQAFDQDADGYSTFDQSKCPAPPGGADCDDTNPAINPGAADICGNGIDENCQGGDRECSCIDEDGDGYFAQDPIFCPNPAGGADCDDTNPAINPGVAGPYCSCPANPSEEVCGNDVDEDCSGAAAGCTTCSDGTFDGECNTKGEVCDAQTNTLTFNCDLCQNACGTGFICENNACVPTTGTCTDGTPSGACNAQHELCQDTGGAGSGSPPHQYQLEFDCETCGCDEGYVCSENTCVNLADITLLLPPIFSTTPPSQQIPGQPRPHSLTDLINQPVHECGAQWACSAWGPCTNNVQQRTCTEVTALGCGKPATTRICTQHQESQEKTGETIPGLAKTPEQEETTKSDSAKEDENAETRARTFLGAPSWIGITVLALFLIIIISLALLKLLAPKHPDTYSPSPPLQTQNNNWQHPPATQATPGTPPPTPAQQQPFATPQPPGLPPVELRINQLKAQGLGYLAIKIRLVNEGYPLPVIEEAMQRSN
ncbi:hypothetical protein D6783_04310 [Candidatus Woesearchaeota archaeon]|nr:MAG: hypothetical protein D6783_04310 [Candidatus Woesearchaeota archaeon]